MKAFNGEKSLASMVWGKQFLVHAFNSKIVLGKRDQQIAKQHNGSVLELIEFYFSFCS